MRKKYNFEAYRKVKRHGFYIGKPLAEKFIAAVKAEGAQINETIELLIQAYLDEKEVK